MPSIVMPGGKELVKPTPAANLMTLGLFVYGSPYKLVCCYCDNPRMMHELKDSRLGAGLLMCLHCEREGNGWIA